MGLFVTSTSNVSRHGVFAVEVPPPASIQATGTSATAIVGQFPWGPKDTVYTPTSIGDFFNTFAPRGMSRTGSAHLSVIRKGWPLLKGVRVLGTASAAATATLSSVTPTALLTVTLKYHGAAGNSVVVTTAAAQDGDANHFDLQLSVTGASGTTTDILHNLNISGVGADALPTQAQINSTILLGSLTKLAAGVPVLTATTCSSGADGTINSARYIGTAGTADLGIALLEGDLSIRHFFADDMGSGSRAAVNAALEAHAALMTNRVAYINGVAAQTAATAQTDVASYRSTRVVYVDAWAYVNDDTDGTLRLAPGAPWAASVAAQLSPSTSIAWKSSVVSQLLAGVAGLEADRGQQIGVNTQSGICTLIKKATGGYAFEAGKNTNFPVNPATGNLTRTRMGDFIAQSVQDSIGESVDAPNVPTNQQDVVNAVDGFLTTLKKNAGRNPNFTPFILDYKIEDLSAVNTQTTTSNGDFILPVQIVTAASMERIFLSVQFGETITISAT